MDINTIEKLLCDAADVRDRRIRQLEQALLEIYALRGEDSEIQRICNEVIAGGE